MYKIFKGFSLAEILITFLIISVIVLASASIVKKPKSAKKDTDNKIGTYACTKYDNNSYVYISEKKDAEIPFPPNGWMKGECGKGFIMPKTGLMTVTIIGAGGKGGDADFDWVDVVEPSIFDESGKFVVPREGKYRIDVYGDIGEQSSLLSWKNDNLNCFAPVSPPGTPAFFSTTVNYSGGETLDIIFNAGKIAPFIAEDANKNDLVAQRGFDGDDIRIVDSNGNEIVVLNGSSAGDYNTTENEKCGNRFTPQNKNGSYVSEYPVSDTDNGWNNTDIYGRVVISYVTDEKFLQMKYGKGGKTAESKEFLYPILKDSLPEIYIADGSGDEENFATFFGDVRVNSGESGQTTEILSDNVPEDADGALPANVTKENAAKAAESGLLNGESAKAFGAGGGGGYFSFKDDVKPVYDDSKTKEDYYSEIFVSKGGYGAPGLIKITW